MPNMINLRHLKAFLAVAETGRVSRGAMRIYRAQSAVTRSILELEGSLGVKLFERNAVGMVLTVYGEALLWRAQRAVAELATAGREVAEAHGQPVAASAPVFSLQVGTRRLAALVALAELRNMPDAAKRVGITQPAVSAAVRDIEGGLKIRLFDRTPRGLVPTAAALALTRRIRLALDELRQAAEELAALQGMMRGIARIGATPFGRTAILPRAAARLLRMHPSVRISVTEGPFDTLAVALRAGELDMVLAALRPFPVGSDLDGEPLIDDQLSLVVRAGHPLTRVRPFSLAALLDAGWILGRTGTLSRQMFDKAWEGTGFAHPTVVAETASLAMNRGLLMESDFVTVLSRHEIEHELRFGMLALLPIEIPELRHQVGLIRRAGSIPSPAAEALIAAIRQAVTDLDPHDPVEP